MIKGPTQKFSNNNRQVDAVSLEFDAEDIRDDIEEAHGKTSSPFKGKNSKYDIEGSGNMSIPDGNVDELLDWAQGLPENDEFKQSGSSFFGKGLN